MDSKVKEFIDAAKSKERAKFEKERDAHLIRLGLVQKEKIRTYNGVSSVPLDVTDEEYEEIKRLTEGKSNEEIKIENAAEKFLGIINSFLLIIGIIAAIVLICISVDSYDSEIYLFSGLGVLLVSLISWSITKVLLNISNNLHKINAKLK